MQIAMVHQPWNPAVPPVDTGSIAIWIYETANRLVGRNEVTTFAKKVRGLPTVQSYAGVCYKRVSIWPNPHSLPGRIAAAFGNVEGRPVFCQPTFFSAYRQRIAKQIRADRIDVAHLHNLVTYPTAIREASKGTRIILHMHCEWLSQIPRALALEFVEPVDQLIACSQYLADRINNHLNDAEKICQILPNGVDIDHFSPAAPVTAQEANRKEILFVGRISPEKGIHDLLEAFNLVQRSIPQASLRIVGPYSPTPIQFIAQATDDPREAALKHWYEADYLTTLKKMAGDRLGNSIIFHGNVPHSELPKFYREATVLANPSISESFGMSLIEALSCGCPVICSNAGGMPEVVEHGKTGYLVNVGDPVGLADALIEILNSRRQRMAMSQNSRSVAASKYSWARIADDLDKLYKRL
jgi:glycosyltransferase involved in cell wall biosynthesis